MFDTGLAYID
jgi:hypothetical protein